jgi:hypothetical protein
VSDLFSKRRRDRSDAIAESIPPTPESDFARRVRERLDSQIDGGAARKSPTKRASKLQSNLWGLPLDPAPGRPGIPAKGQAKPTDHEASILRRLARPGAFVLVTLREGKEPLYSYEDGSRILNEAGNRINERDFARLRTFLVPERKESLFDDGPPQRFFARRAEGR